MSTLAIIIYLVVSFFLGFTWPIDMFFRGGILGIILSLSWVALLLA